ncbi:hypothetical protein AB0N05_35110 [Nocardia sp. NPDC051030]|uniref:hypothetical protein n=1 Tax=Nocardia sp. NPDC051030 TaxID=3155162 RepID=UPI0034463223
MSEAAEMRSARAGMAALTAAGVTAGPIAGGCVVLLAKPFGGELGVPGEVIGYIATTALLCGCVTAAWGARRSPGARWIGGYAVIAGAGWVAAGSSTHVGVFVTAVLVASLAAGPVLAAGYTLALRRGRGTLIGWHVAMWGGIAAMAGLAARCDTAPGIGLRTTGIAAIVLGSLVAVLNGSVTQWNSVPDSRAERDAGGSWLLLIGYAGVGVGVGGTVLPALHLLLFRWSALDAEQAELLLVAALPAMVIAALQAPALDALPALLTLLAGGALLVATAPGRETVTIGLAVTLAAAARALRALDAAEHARAPEAARARGIPIALAVPGAGMAGLGLMVLLGRIAGTGTGLVLLAVPVLTAALVCERLIRTPGTERTVPALGGEIP